MDDQTIFEFTIYDDKSKPPEMKVNPKYDTGRKYTVAPKLESCTREEWIAFIKNYPNKLQEDYYMDAYSYNDFTIAKMWPDSIVALAFPSHRDDEEDTYKIATNMDEVFASIKGGK